MSSDRSHILFAFSSGMRYYLTLVLIWISLIITNVEHFFCVLIIDCTFVFSKGAYLFPFLIFDIVVDIELCESFISNV